MGHIGTLGNEDTREQLVWGYSRESHQRRRKAAQKGEKGRRHLAKGGLERGGIAKLRELTNREGGALSQRILRNMDIKT